MTDYDRWKLTPPRDDTPPTRCPICESEDAEYLYYNIDGDCVGCDCCVRRRPT